MRLAYRITAAAGVAAALSMTLPVPAIAAPTSAVVGDFSFEGDPDNPSAGATLTQCHATVGANIVVPDSVSIAGVEMDVVAIADEACHRDKIGAPRDSVTIPDTVRTVGVAAFQNLGLNSASLGDGVQSIGALSFAGNDLQTVHLPAGISEVPYRAFAGNRMTSFSVAGTAVVLKEQSFEGNSFQGLAIPHGVSEIGTRAFDVDALYDVRIPASVTSIASDAFGTDFLQSVFFEGDLPTWPGAAGTIDIVWVYYYVGAAGYEWVDVFTFPDSTVTAMVKVTFDTGGYGTAPSPVDVPVGGTVTQPTLATRPAFDFTGWFDAPTGGQAWDFAVSSFTSHTTLYARWADTPESVTAPASAEQGETISVSGAGFQPGESLELWLLATPLLLATVTADADGTFATSLTIPYSVATGPTTLEVRGGQSEPASRSITVSAGPPPGVGATTVINGMEFRVIGTSPPEVLLVRHVLPVPGDIVIPQRVTIGGIDFDVTAIGDSAFGADALETVRFEGNEPTLGSVWANLTGTTVYYYTGATGFAPGDWPVSTLVELVRVSFDTGGFGTTPPAIELPIGEPLTPPVLSDRPTFDFLGWYDAPTGGALVDLTAIRDHMTLYARWVDTPEFLDAPAGAAPGDVITLTGSGFQPGESVEIWLLSTPVRLAVLSADASGAFSVTVTIPANITPGSHTLEVRGSQSATYSRPFAVFAGLSDTGPHRLVTAVALASLLLAGAGAALLFARRRVATPRN